MKTVVYSRDLPESFLERDMFQTEVVEKIKTHHLIFSENLCRLYENVEIFGEAREATDVNKRHNCNLI